ncbi:LysR family transcriptional regulator [Shewanella maritima]|uniref:LysR family transcriptional regulator n=1 Tax=Shewanella maritima TaxID=2520507 RepID=A0A411PMI7_9GAMM|nr:LysR family transcriptional regulator [Shewanella maritima]QBF84719.1 LysR family transcriptional regulator [Shewanella maritima]
MNRAKSTLEQWRILQAVVDQGGYAQAAAYLNKSQSSLNHAVAKLQQQLGTQILTVEGRRSVLTPQGEVLLRRSRLLTQSVNELEQLAANLGQGWEPSLTIAREIIYPMDDLVCIFNKFHPQSRGCRINVIDSVLTGTHELINEQKADIAICSTPPKGHLGEALQSSELILVCHPGHSLAATPNISDEKILANQLQIVIRDTGLNAKDEAGWLKSEQRWTVSNFYEAKRILASGLGFCWMPAFIVKDEIDNGKLAKLTLTSSKSRKVILNLVVPNRDRQGPAAKLLEQLVLAHHRT